MRIPKKIKIGCFDYRIEELDNVVIGTSTHHWGSHSQEELSIDIRKDFPSEFLKAETLLHEIIHGICDGAFMYKQPKYDVDMEELYVSVVARDLIAVLKNNPKLREYLMEVLDA